MDYSDTLQSEGVVDIVNGLVFAYCVPDTSIAVGSSLNCMNVDADACAVEVDSIVASHDQLWQVLAMGCADGLCAKLAVSEVVEAIFK